MRDRPPPYRFDLRAVIEAGRRKLAGRVGGVSISLPFLSFSVNPDDLERRVAKELVIRVSDKRVLNAFECCDGCIDNALASLQEIRSILVNARVTLAGVADGPLVLVLDAMLVGIRQFLTFEQRLSRTPAPPQLLDRHGRPSRDVLGNRDEYFGGLEVLRAHLHRCLQQVGKVADVEVPVREGMTYAAQWDLAAYEAPEKGRITMQ